MIKTLQHNAYEGKYTLTSKLHKSPATIVLLYFTNQNLKSYV